MPEYVLCNRAQGNGDYVVHERACKWAPKPTDAHPLGFHASCHGAFIQAKAIEPQANGCKLCCPDCHSSYAMPSGRNASRSSARTP